MEALTRQSRRLSPRTLEWYEQRLGWFQAWLTEQDIETVPDITTNDIRRYVAEISGKDWSSWTVHGSARCIKAFLNFCVAEGWITQTTGEIQ